MDEFLRNHATHLSPEELIRYAELSEQPLVTAFMTALARKWRHDFDGAVHEVGTKQFREELKEELSERVKDMSGIIDTMEEVIQEMLRRVSYDELPSTVTAFFAEVRKKDFLNLPDA